MLGMPVATLRVWERRYRLTQPGLTPNGQRRYSADDVQRLALIKQLTDLGHAIGSLAPLDMPRLQRVAATHAQALASSQRAERPEKSETVFNLGYTTEAAEKWPWVASMSGGVAEGHPRQRMKKAA